MRGSAVIGVSFLTGIAALCREKVYQEILTDARACYHEKRE